MMSFLPLLMMGTSVCTHTNTHKYTQTSTQTHAYAMISGLGLLVHHTQQNLLRVRVLGKAASTKAVLTDPVSM